MYTLEAKKLAEKQLTEARTMAQDKCSLQWEKSRITSQFLPINISSGSVKFNKILYKHWNVNWENVQNNVLDNMNPCHNGNVTNDKSNVHWVKPFIQGYFGFIFH